MECRWNAGGRVRMRLRRLPSEDERFRRAAAAVAAVRHIGMSACRHVGMSAARPVAHCAAQSCAEPRAIAVLEMPRGQRRRRESNRAQRAGRVLSRPIGATFAMRIVKERGERREVARVYHPGRREGGKAGRREGGKAGRREGVVVQCPWTVRKEGNVSSGGPNHGQACVFRGIQGRSDTTRRRAGLPLFQGVWGGWNWGDSPASLGRAVAGGA